MSDLLHRQFMSSARYGTWANERLYERVSVLLSDDDRDIPGDDARHLVGLLNQVLVVGRLWFARLRGYDPGIGSLDEWLYEDVEELRAAQAADDVELCDYLHGLAKEDMSRPIPYQDLNGEAHANSQQELLVELFASQDHFRGRICERLYALRAEPPELDYLAFLRETGA